LVSETYCDLGSGYFAQDYGYNVSNLQRTAEGPGVGLTVVWALTIILNFCALIFSAIFTWGRDFVYRHDMQWNESGEKETVPRAKVYYQEEKVSLEN